ncbi:hypothetical protein MTO96_029599 [Rhipicephalus appendiculatus]
MVVAMAWGLQNGVYGIGLSEAVGRRPGPIGAVQGDAAVTPHCSTTSGAFAHGLPGKPPPPRRRRPGSSSSSSHESSPSEATASGTRDTARPRDSPAPPPPRRPRPGSSTPGSSDSGAPASTPSRRRQSGRAATPTSSGSSSMAGPGTPTPPVRPRQPVVARGVLKVYLPAPTPLRCPQAWLPGVLWRHLVDIAGAVIAATLRAGARPAVTGAGLPVLRVRRHASRAAVRPPLLAVPLADCPDARFSTQVYPLPTDLPVCAGPREPQALAQRPGRGITREPSWSPGCSCPRGRGLRRAPGRLRRTGTLSCEHPHGRFPADVTAGLYPSSSRGARPRRHCNPPSRRRALARFVVFAYSTRSRVRRRLLCHRHRRVLRRRTSATDPDLGEVGDETEDEAEDDPDGDNTMDLPPDNTNLFAEQVRALRATLRDAPTDQTWERCETAWSQAVALATEAVRLPPASSSRPSRTINPNNAADIQRLYRRNRRRAIRLVVEGPSRSGDIPLQDLHDHWASTWAERAADTALLFERPVAPQPVDTSRFTADEVLARLRKAENTAPGSDRLTYRHWKSVDPEARFLSALFNACLHHRRTPDSWRTSRTVLIYKKGDPSIPGNWRPIALGCTASKLYAKCLAARLQTWVMEHHLMSHCQ